MVLLYFDSQKTRQAYYKKKGISMSQIKLEKISEDKIEELDVYSWPTWEKGVSTFPWHYDDTETCLILEGQATVTPKGGDPVEIKKGDFVVFPAGMDCTWEITVALKKHFKFG